MIQSSRKNECLSCIGNGKYPRVNDPSMLNAVGEKLQAEVTPVRIEGGRQFHKDKPHSDTPWFEGK